MIARRDWTTYHRDEDAEHLGHLVPQPDDATSFQPVTVFGYPPATATDPAAARGIRDGHGPGYLADRSHLTWTGGRTRSP